MGLLPSYPDLFCANRSGGNPRCERGEGTRPACERRRSGRMGAAPIADEERVAIGEIALQCALTNPR
jgi:hypothetical protein